MSADSLFRQPDVCFAHPRLAAVYDIVDGSREDLDLYIDVAAEFGAKTVVDVGCGTGALAAALAALDLNVIGLDPAEASLDVARQRPGADRIQWINGVAADLTPSIKADLATMTGNVAQVFLTDEEWSANLCGIRSVLCSQGWLVFETRILSVRAWEKWTRERTYRRHELPEGETLDYWIDLTSVEPPLISFRSHYHFQPDDVLLTSDSTLRFRSEEEIRASLTQAGFVIDDVRDAPDRPGLEMVFIAQARQPDQARRRQPDPRDP